MNLEEALEILESVIGDKVKAYREAKKEAKKVAKAIDTYEEVHKGHHSTPYRGQLEVKLEDAKKGIRATKTNEALELMEAVINEVSVGALARAAENNLAKRTKDATSAVTKFEKAQDNYEKMSKKHPEEEPALYRKLQADDAAAVKEVDRAEHADDVARLKLPKNSKVSANKLFKAARKVESKRDKEVDTNKRANEFVKALNRARRSDDINFADPVKSRTNEALAIAEEMLQLANSIFEVAPEAPVSAEEVPPSNNEIKQIKKDKENPEKKREVVSVADELFPYEGNAKQQMNQKILAKINQMIEGTATLEDLLQLVRRGTKKAPATK